MKKLIALIKKTHQKQQLKTQNVDLKQIWRHPLHWITCGFGVGLLPAPGTFGTLLGVLLYLLLHRLPLGWYLLIVAVLNSAGIFMCGKVNRDFKTDDHPAAVWDEIAAFPIVMIGVACTWYWIAAGFLLFRLFDIFKPGPIGWLDRHVHGGFGVMIDDIAAAIASLACLQLFIHFIFY